MGLAKCPNWTGAYAGKEHLSLVREGSRGAQGDMVGMAFGWIVFGPCRSRNVAGSSGTETTGDDGHSECPRRACPAPLSTPCGVGVGETRRSAKNEVRWRGPDGPGDRTLIPQGRAPDQGNLTPGRHRSFDGDADAFRLDSNALWTWIALSRRTTKARPANRWATRMAAAPTEGWTANACSAASKRR